MTNEQLAHLKVLETAIIYARQICYRSDSENSLMVADLLDAVHNTPAYIEEMFCPSAEYVQLYYAAFNSKYPHSLSLVATFNRALGSHY